MVSITTKLQIEEIQSSACYRIWHDSICDQDCINGAVQALVAGTYDALYGVLKQI